MVILMKYEYVNKLMSHICLTITENDDNGEDSDGLARSNHGKNITKTRFNVFFNPKDNEKVFSRGKG